MFAIYTQSLIFSNERFRTVFYSIFFLSHCATVPYRRNKFQHLTLLVRRLLRIKYKRQQRRNKLKRRAICDQKHLSRCFYVLTCQTNKWINKNISLTFKSVARNIHRGAPRFPRAYKNKHTNTSQSNPRLSRGIKHMQEKKKNRPSYQSITSLFLCFTL